jgi:hypothetical protein
MPQVRVKLTQVMHTFKSPKYTAVGGVEIALTNRGGGKSAVTTTWQDATLELVEVEGANGSTGPKGLKDATKGERVLVKIAGFIREQNGSPFFTTGNATTPSGSPPVVMFRKPDSDFALELIWDSHTFAVGTIDAFLRFPWESSEEGFFQELRARLTVGTTVEADLKDNDKPDIQMRHEDVPEDGAPGGAPSVCFGFGTAYPVKNNHMKDTETVPFTGKTMNVFIHKDVGAAINALAPNEYDFTKVTAALNDILASGGFTSVNIAEVDWTDPRLTAIGSVSGGAGSQQLALNGRAIPFFDSWILLDRQTTWKAGMESARSESATFQLSAATKVLTSTIMILNGAISNFIPLLATGQANIFFANLFAHEIGHGLGLSFSPRGDFLIVAVCLGTDRCTPAESRAWYDNDAHVFVRDASGKIERAALIDPGLDFISAVRRTPEGDIYALAEYAGVIYLAVSRDRGHTFVRHELPTVEGKKGDYNPRFETSRSIRTLHAEDGGTVVVIASVLPEGWVRYVSRDFGQHFEGRLLPIDVDSLDLAGRRGFAYLDTNTEAAWETNDAGATWHPAKLPLERPPYKVHYTSRVACGEAGCLFDASIVRLGWDLPSTAGEPLR